MDVTYRGLIRALHCCHCDLFMRSLINTCKTTEWLQKFGYLYLVPLCLRARHCHMHAEADKLSLYSIWISGLMTLWWTADRFMSLRVWPVSCHIMLRGVRSRGGGAVVVRRGGRSTVELSDSIELGDELFGRGGQVYLCIFMYYMYTSAFSGRVYTLIYIHFFYGPKHHETY